MSAADPSRVVAAAREWLGTPYHDQASTLGAGCDCLGLARGVWRAVVGDEPFDVPPYTRGWGEVSGREVLLEAARQSLIEIPVMEIVPGAVLLFRMRPNAIAQHCGILTEPGRFIHSYERHGVIEQPFLEVWRRRLAFAFLYPSAVT